MKVIDSWEYFKAVELEKAREKESLVLQYIRANPETKVEDIVLCQQTEGFTTRIWIERKGDQHAE